MNNTKAKYTNLRKCIQMEQKHCTNFVTHLWMKLKMFFTKVLMTTSEVIGKKRYMEIELNLKQLNVLNSGSKYFGSAIVAEH